MNTQVKSNPFDTLYTNLDKIAAISDLLYVAQDISSLGTSTVKDAGYGINDMAKECSEAVREIESASNTKPDVSVVKEPDTNTATGEAESENLSKEDPKTIEQSLKEMYTLLYFIADSLKYLKENPPEIDIGDGNTELTPYILESAYLSNEKMFSHMENLRNILIGDEDFIVSASVVPSIRIAHAH